jgi:hypothetical protein
VNEGDFVISATGKRGAATASVCILKPSSAAWKLNQFHRLSTVELIESPAPGRPGALKARPDGTVLDGHHRIVVLREREVSVDTLPHEVGPREVGE